MSVGLKEWFVVLNPVVKGGVSAAIQVEIQEMLSAQGFDFEYRTTEGSLHATSLVEEAIIAGYRKVISIGGGGTLNEVINGIKEQNICEFEDVELIHIPNGAVNDWATHHGVPTDYKKWIPMLRNTTVKLHDVGIAHYTVENMDFSKYFVCNAGTAVAGAIIRTLYADYENTGVGKSDVRKSAFKIASKLRYFDLKLSYNEKEIRDKYVIVHIAVCNYFGRYQFAKDADPFSGQFTLVRDKGSVPGIRYVMSLSRLFNGTFYKNKQIVAEKTSSLHVDASSSSYTNYSHIDGEFLTSGNVTFAISSKKLRVRLPY